MGQAGPLAADRYIGKEPGQGLFSRDPNDDGPTGRKQFDEMLKSKPPSYFGYRRSSKALFSAIKADLAGVGTRG